MKNEKQRHNFNILKTTFDKLKDFCDKHRRWTMSAFVDVAIEEKLERENSK